MHYPFKYENINYAYYKLYLFFYIISISSVFKFPFVEFGCSWGSVSLKYMATLNCLLFVVFEIPTHLGDSSVYSSLSLVTTGRETIRTLWQNESSLASESRESFPQTTRWHDRWRPVQHDHWQWEQVPTVYHMCCRTLSKTSLRPSPWEVVSCLASSSFFRKLNVCAYLRTNARVFSLFIILLFCKWYVCIFNSSLSLSYPSGVTSAFPSIQY